MKELTITYKVLEGQDLDTETVFDLLNANGMVFAMRQLFDIGDKLTAGDRPKLKLSVIRLEPSAD